MMKSARSGEIFPLLSKDREREAKLRVGSSSINGQASQHDSFTLDPIPIQHFERSSIHEVWNNPRMQMGTKLWWFIKYYTFHPTSDFMSIWNAIIFLVIIYNALSIPLRIGYHEAIFPFTHDDSFIFDGAAAFSSPVFILFFILDYTTDLILYMNIFIQAKTAYFDSGFLIYDPSLKLKNYVATTFLIDLFSSMPYSIVVLYSPVLSACLRLPRMILLYHIPAYFASWQLNSRFPVLFQLSELLAGLFLIIHFLSGVYFFVGTQEGFSTEWGPSKETGESSFPVQYLHGIYWGTRAVTGFGGEVPGPDSNAEILVMLIIAFLGLFMVAVVIGWLADTIGSLNEERKVWTSKMAKVNRWMEGSEISYDLRRRVKGYYEHLWSRQKGVIPGGEEAKWLEEVPVNLKNDILMYLHQDVIQKVPLFKDCSKAFIKVLVNYLKPQIYFPGDTIVKVGDIGSQMFFIRRGVVDIYNSEKLLLTSLGEGGFFGEIALLIKAKRTATAKAKEYCDVFVLEKEDLDKVLKDFVEEKESILNVAEGRIANDMLRKVVKEEEPIWEDFGEGFLEEMVDSLQYERREDGETWWVEGEPSTMLMFLGQGEVIIEHKGAEVAREKEGKFLGVVDLAIERSREATVKSVGRSVGLVLKQSEWQKLFDSHNEDDALERMKERFGKTSDYLPQSYWKDMEVKAPSRENSVPGGLKRGRGDGRSLKRQLTTLLKRGGGGVGGNSSGTRSNFDEAWMREVTRLGEEGENSDWMTDVADRDLEELSEGMGRLIGRVMTELGKRRGRGGGIGGGNRRNLDNWNGSFVEEERGRRVSEEGSSGGGSGSGRRGREQSESGSFGAMDSPMITSFAAAKRNNKGKEF